MHKEIKIFFTALMFLTRIPCSKISGCCEEYLNKSPRYFPLVGIIIGVFASLVYYLSYLLLPQNLSVLISITLTILLTGAMHEDGFADFCDGFGAGENKEKILSIMKDSFIGTYGTLGLILIVAFKYIILCDLSPLIVPYVLIAGHSVSRFVTVSFIYAYDYVRISDNTSKTNKVAVKISLMDFLIAFLFSVIPILILGYRYLLIFIVLIIFKEIIGYYFKKKIGGYTGDCLGTVQQITEVLFYFLVLIDPWKYI